MGPKCFTGTTVPRQLQPAVITRAEAKRFIMQPSKKEPVNNYFDQVFGR